MQGQISWDPLLVKKFGSSNHFKLLNQLKTEVKKYPLKKKNIKQTKHFIDDKSINKSLPVTTNNKVLTSSNTDIYKQDFNNQQSNTIYKSSHNSHIANQPNQDIIKENDESLVISSSLIDNSDSINSNISFNNSKNFNIYNNNIYSSSSKDIQIQNSDDKFTISDKSTTKKSFKDRLDQIDMK